MILFYTIYIIYIIVYVIIYIIYTASMICGQGKATKYKNNGLLLRSAVLTMRQNIGCSDACKLRPHCP